MQRYRSLIVLVTVLCICLVGGWWWINPSQHIISPLADAPWFGFTPTDSSEQNKYSPFLVLGYVPFWNLAKTTIQPELDALAYFSLSIGPDGQIVTEDDDGNAEPGYHRISSDDWLELTSIATRNQTQLELTFSQLSNDAIEEMLASPTASTTFLRDLDASLLSLPISAIHLDIEYIGSPSAEMRSQFVSFVAAVDSHLAERYPQMPLRLAIYAGAAEKYQLWDLPALVPFVDSFIVMTYDFHRANSPIAGPVAPLYGHDTYWEGDINYYLSSLLKQLPSDKVLLGIPFYGYQWQTTVEAPLAATFPRTGSTASYDRVQELITTATQPISLGWDDRALSPYLTYTDTTTNRHYVIYYENEASVSYKLELARQLKLGGIAIWALGYEGAHRSLWDTIGHFDSIE